jgi:hypothetical protein
LVFPIIAYTLSSTKLRVKGKILSAGYGGGVREGVGEEGRNDPNIVCIYELKKKQKLFK